VIRPPSKETWVLVLGLSALVGGLGSRRLFHNDDGVKNVWITPASFDFGKVRQGKTLEHTFRLSNGGAIPIVITKAESSCSCTTTEDPTGRTIAPGSGIDVPVSIKSGVGDGPESGLITLYYRLASLATAPVHFASIRVTADVDPDYRVRPTLIDFGTVDGPGPVSRTIRLRPEALADMAIVRLSSTNDVLSARRLESPPDDHDLLVEVTFSGRSLWKSGPVEAMASIETTSVGCPITQVLARVRYVAPVEVEPSSIVIGARSPGSIEREIRIDAAWPVRIKALRSSDPAVRITPNGPSEGRTLRIKATISGDEPRRAINAEAAIDLASSPGMVATKSRTVTIPIHRLARE